MLYDAEAARRMCVSNTFSPRTDPVIVGSNVRPLAHSDCAPNTDDSHIPIIPQMAVAGEGNDSTLQPSARDTALLEGVAAIRWRMGIES